MLFRDAARRQDAARRCLMGKIWLVIFLRFFHRRGWFSRDYRRATHAQFEAYLHATEFIALAEDKAILLTQEAADSS